ncbi:hypothetical protein BGZ94_006322 [Podila epigama]|nr:hypothetical protein BGZ94_006322 [Podila epigama]
MLLWNNRSTLVFSNSWSSFVATLAKRHYSPSSSFARFKDQSTTVLGTTTSHHDNALHSHFGKSNNTTKDNNNDNDSNGASKISNSDSNNNSDDADYIDRRNAGAYDLQRRGKGGQRLTSLLRWKPEDDEKIYNSMRMGKTTQEIYSEFFGSRSWNSVAIRMSRLRQAARKSALLHKDNSLRDHQGLKEEDKSTEGDGSLKVPQLFSRRSWTEEEDAILTELFKRFPVDSHEKWRKVAEGMKDFGRTSTSCQRRWEIISTGSKGGNGHFSKDEVERLLSSVSAQVGPQFLPKVNPSPDKEYVENGKKALVLGGPELMSLNWNAVAKKVGTRSSVQCRSHFYKKQHTAKRGHWSPEENRILREAVEEYGDQWHKVSRALGTRTPDQARVHWRKILQHAL